MSLDGQESSYRAIERLIATYAELVDDGNFAAVDDDLGCGINQSRQDAVGQARATHQRLGRTQVAVASVSHLRAEAA